MPNLSMGAAWVIAAADNTVQEIGYCPLSNIDSELLKYGSHFAEIVAATMAIQRAPKNSEIYLYSDYKHVVGTLGAPKIKRRNSSDRIERKLKDDLIYAAFLTPNLTVENAHNAGKTKNLLKLAHDFANYASTGKNSSIISATSVPIQKYEYTGFKL